MLVNVTFKTPDAVEEAIQAALENNRPAGLTDHEWGLILEDRRDALKEKAKNWFEWMEYVSITWDTEKDTCIVNRS